MMKWIKQVIKHTHSRRFTRVAGALLVVLVGLQLIPTPPKSVTADADNSETYYSDSNNAGAENDVLYDAQHFMLFGDTVTTGSNATDGNIAANKYSGDGGGTTSLPLYQSQNKQSEDLFYINSFTDDTSHFSISRSLLKNVKLVLGDDDALQYTAPTKSEPRCLPLSGKRSRIL